MLLVFICCFTVVMFYPFPPLFFIFHIVNHPRNIHTEEWHTIKGCEPLSDGAGITDGCTHRQCTLQVLLFGLSLLFPSSCQHFSNPPYLLTNSSSLFSPSSGAHTISQNVFSQKPRQLPWPSGIQWGLCYTNSVYE